MKAVLVAVLLVAMLGVILTSSLLLVTYRSTREDRRQRQVLEAQVDAQQRLMMLTHASLQAMRTQLRGR